MKSIAFALVVAWLVVTCAIGFCAWLMDGLAHWRWQ